MATFRLLFHSPVSATVLAIGLICLAEEGTSAAPPTAPVGDLSTPPSTAADSAATAWVEQNEQRTLREVAASSPDEASSQIDTLWVHVPDSTAYVLRESEAPIDAFRSYCENGGRLLFANQAARLPHALGIEASRPETRVLDVTNDEHNDEKGFQSFRGHPVFGCGLLGGDQIWDATRDHELLRVGCFGSAVPDEGAVLGVKRARTGVRSGKKLLIEHNRGEEHVLSAGAVIYPNRPNRLRVKQDRFLEDALFCLAGTLDSNEEPTCRRCHESAPTSLEVSSQPVSPATNRSLSGRPATELVRFRSSPADEFFNVAGRRAIAMGEENDGIKEVWTHPFKLMFDDETGIVRSDSVTWLPEVPVDVEVRPEAFTRTYDLRQGVMAGHGFSNPDGGTRASGPPGDAWYFGRNAEWAGFTFNAYGDPDAVRKQLTMPQENQDLQGKIYHALDTPGPGVQQYNAADSTPLYVILAGHYHRASGSKAFLEDSWPHLKRAMHFGQLDAEKTAPFPDALASNRFSTDWGTRIVDRNSSLFDPDSYHLGTVWPLFTGWSALAEYEYGRGTAGFRHVTNNMYVKDHWALGYVEEVLNGRTHTPDGFSPHQAWSEANILHPTIAFQHTGGIGLGPVTPDPSPGDWSLGYRVVSTSLDGSTHMASPEGRAGTSHTFQIRLFDRLIAAVEGAEAVPSLEQGVTDLRVSFDPAAGRYADATVTVQLTPAPASR